MVWIIRTLLLTQLALGMNNSAGGRRSSNPMSDLENRIAAESELLPGGYKRGEEVYSLLEDVNLPFGTKGRAVGSTNGWIHFRYADEIDVIFTEERLGIAVLPTTTDNSGKGFGAIVNHVWPSCPYYATQAGVRAGLIITKVEGIDVRNMPHCDILQNIKQAPLPIKITFKGEDRIEAMQPCQISRTRIAKEDVPLPKGYKIGDMVYKTGIHGAIQCRARGKIIGPAKSKNNRAGLMIRFEEVAKRRTMSPTQIELVQDFLVNIQTTLDGAFELHATQNTTVEELKDAFLKKFNCEKRYRYDKYDSKSTLRFEGARGKTFATDGLFKFSTLDEMFPVKYPERRMRHIVSLRVTLVRNDSE